MTLYVYEVDTNKIVSEYEGNSNAECDAKLAADGRTEWGDGDWNDFGLATTYTPAFGCTDGLHY